MLVPAPTRAAEERLRALRRSALFRELDEPSLARMDAALEWLSLEADSVLFSDGDPGDALFVVIDGRIDIWRPGDDGVETLVSRLGPGQPIGELALLGDRPRSATARAARDSVVVRLSRPAFVELGLHDPRITLALSRFLVERALAGPPPRPRATTFAVVAASRDAPVDRFTDRLVAALSGWSPSARIDAATLDAAVGAGAAQSTVGDHLHGDGARWLDAREAAVSSLVLVADRAGTAWTERCVRRADVILLVADAASSPSALPGRLGAPRQGAFDRRELVLIHRDGASRPDGARRFLDAFSVDAWHHVRVGEIEDLRRLGRWLTGRAVALALSGGAARGMAHAGVLRALREAGVPIDLVCGTSIGSFVASLAALEWSAERIGEVMRANLAERSALDYRVPIVSMASGRRFDGVLQELFGDGRVEDTWRRFFCMSCSLTRSTAVAHRTGSMARAVRASCALPGLFPPVVDGGDVLVDGVFLDNLPAELAMAEAAGRTIAVNVLPAVGAAEWSQIVEGGALRQAARMLNPWAEVRLPPILQLTMQGVFLGTNNASVRIRKAVDLFIEPPVGKIWFLDFGQYDKIVEAGYRAAQRDIAAWLARDPGVLTGS